MNKKSPRTIPYSEDAERTVLGSILIDGGAFLKIADLLAPKDFYVPAHMKIYAVMEALFERNQPIDVVSVGARLKEQGILEDIGGSGYLAELTNEVATAAHVTHFAEVVRSYRVLRDVIHTGGSVAEEAYGKTPDDVEDFIDDVESRVLAISQQSRPKSFVELSEELHGAMERIAKLHDNKGELRGVPTGFRDLDSTLSGLQRSDLVILGARPSVGKTSLALDMARNAAKKGFSVAFFSLEMAKEQVIDRLISAESLVPLWRLRTGRISDDTDFQMISRGIDTLSGASVYIDDTPSPTIMQVRAMARRLQIESKKGLDMIVIDYLQLITPRRSNDNMVQQVTEISRGLKSLAREMNVPVLALSQLSRGVDQRDHKVPRLSDLRESGSIEQDADVVMLLYREKERSQEVSPVEFNTVTINIAKHRNGPTKVTKLFFEEEYASFRSIDREHESASHTSADPFAF